MMYLKALKGYRFVELAAGEKLHIYLDAICTGARMWLV